MLRVHWIDLTECCERCNEPSGATADGEPLEQLMYCSLINKDSVKS
jgi:hypothetical protein